MIQYFFLWLSYVKSFRLSREFQPPFQGTIQSDLEDRTKLLRKPQYCQKLPNHLKNMQLSH